MVARGVLDEILLIGGTMLDLTTASRGLLACTFVLSANVAYAQDQTQPDQKQPDQTQPAPRTQPQVQPRTPPQKQPQKKRAPHAAEPAAQTPAPTTQTVEGAQLEVHVEAPTCTASCPEPAPAAASAERQVDPQARPGGYLDRTYPTTGVHYRRTPRVSRLEYITGLEPPDGYRETSEPRIGLVIGGSITLGLGYVNSVIGGVAIEDGRGMPLVVPIAGPWIAMGTLGEDGGARAGLALAGLSQAAGATMLILGLALQKKSLVKYTAANVEITASPLPGGASLSVTY